MKILIADKLEDSAVALLTSKGFQVEAMPSLKDQSLVEALLTHQPQILVVRSTKVNAEMCAATDALELIIRAGAGVNNIDLEASKSILFTPAPARMINSRASVAAHISALTFVERTTRICG